MWLSHSLQTCSKREVSSISEVLANPLWGFSAHFFQWSPLLLRLSHSLQTCSKCRASVRWKKYLSILFKDFRIFLPAVLLFYALVTLSKPAPVTGRTSISKTVNTQSSWVRTLALKLLQKIPTHRFLCFWYFPPAIQAFDGVLTS